MEMWGWFLAGFIVGVFIIGGPLGLLLGCCLAAAGNADEQAEQQWADYRREEPS